MNIYLFMQKNRRKSTFGSRGFRSRTAKARSPGQKLIHIYYGYLSNINISEIFITDIKLQTKIEENLSSEVQGLEPGQQRHVVLKENIIYLHIDAQ